MSMRGGMIMSRSFKNNNFDTLLTVTTVVLKSFIIGLFILIGFLAIGTLVVLFLPKELLDYNLDNLETINLSLMNIQYDIDPSDLTGIINVKLFLIFGGITALFNLTFLQFIFIYLRKIVVDVKEKTPFSDENIKRFNYIGYAYLTSAVVLPLMNSSFLTIGINLLAVERATVNYMVNFQSIFMGILIILLAKIFEYGAYLQNEYDMTV